MISFESIRIRVNPVKISLLKTESGIGLGAKIVIINEKKSDVETNR